jgi:outer membrane immunogenic protein
MKYKSTHAGVLALAACLVGGTFGASSLATDIQSMSITPVSVYNWTGLYGGVNAGAGWETATPNVSFASSTIFLPSSAATGTETVNGFIGGGQLGFNWQVSSVVLGVEGDFQGTTQKNAIAVGGSALVTNSIENFGTVRGRVGVALGRWMPYVTAGGGYGTFQSSINAGPLGTFSSPSSHGFFAVGTGLEVMVWDHASFKIEYLYMDTGTTTNSFAALTPAALAFLGTSSVGTLTASTRVRDNIFRAGLNYHF